MPSNLDFAVRDNRIVYDITTAQTTYDIDLPAWATRFRLTGKWRTAVSTFTGFRIRRTGQGAVDTSATYYNSQHGQSGGSPFAYANSTDTYANVSGQFGQSEFTNSHFVEISPGISGQEYPRLSGVVQGFNNGGGTMNTVWTCEPRPVAIGSMTRIDRLQVYSTVANGIGVGSQFILECI